MKNRIHSAFDQVRASEELKEATVNHLTGKMKRTESQRKRRPPYAAAAISFLLLISAGTFSHNLLLVPRGYIDLDVNPSLSLSVNAFGRVVDSGAYNEEGTAILTETETRRKPWQEAVASLLESISSHGYIDQSDLLSITVQTEDSRLEKRLLDGLEDLIPSALDASDPSSVDSSSLETELYSVSGQVRQQAQSHHLSPAKYLAALELVEVNPSATLESCASHSISEIRQQTHQHRSSSQGRDEDGDSGREGERSQEQRQDRDHHQNGH